MCRSAFVIFTGETRSSKRRLAFPSKLLHTCGMPSRIDPQTARMLLTELGWFGPRPIYHGGLLVDGRVRFREAVSMGLTLPTSIEATSNGDLIRLLCLVGHYERAKLLVPEVLCNSRDLGAYCHCAPEVVAPLCRKSVRHCGTLRGNATARRREAIEGITRLLRAAENHGGVVTAEQIREVLRPWL